MKHLTEDEIIDFISAEKLDENFLNQARKINTHIGNCKVCFEKLKAFQTVYDEFCDMANINDLRKKRMKKKNAIAVLS